MPILTKLKEFLDASGVHYEVRSHRLAFTAQEVAAAEHVPGREVAKVVMVRDGTEYLMAVLPAPYHVGLERLRKAAGRTGLRLATDYGIIKQTGGRVTVDSGIDKGTTFRIYLPAAEGLPEEDRDNITALGNAERPETILIAEDQNEVLSLVSLVLEEAGHNVLEANNSDAAILTCERHKEPIDLLLIDVVMPHMSGPELARRLTALHPEMKVLFMSGYIDSTIDEYGVFSNGRSFLQKPFTPANLLGKVREVLDAPLERTASLTPG
jgi:CheY-like chemotaxis protein